MEKTIENTFKGIKSLIIGATGACGRELTELLLKSDHYAEVYVIVRRKIDRWEKLPEKEKDKLKIVISEDLDVLLDENNLSKLLEGNTQFDSLFCCLGTRTKEGDEKFIKVDYTYVVESAAICEKFNIPHFSLISSMGADSSSWFLYMKTKGRAEEDCLKKKIPYISILRPGLILNRDNDCRFGEKVFSIVPFISKIKSVDIAKAMLVDDVTYQKNKSSQDKMVSKLFTNAELKELAIKEI